MNKKQFMYLWVVVQISLFILPILICGIIVPKYEMSWDKHYIKTVRTRAMEGYANNKLTDFSDAEIAKYDAEGKYEDKVWKLQHKEIYYFEGIGVGFLIGLLCQLFNIFWYGIDEVNFISW